MPAVGLTATDCNAAAHAKKKIRLKLPVRHQRPELWCPVGNGDGGGCHGARAGAGRGVHAPAGLKNT